MTYGTALPKKRLTLAYSSGVTAAETNDGAADRLFSRIAGPAKRLASVGCGHLLTQGSQVVAGILLVHWLPVQAYAAFAFCLSVQIGASTLVDLGLGQSLIALSGRSYTDKYVMGGLVSAALKIRARFLWLSVALIPLVFVPLDTLKLGQSYLTASLLSGITISYLALQQRTLYEAPLLLAGKVRAYYVANISGNVVRLGSCVALHAAGVLSAASATATGVLAVAVTGGLLRRLSLREDLVVLPRQAQPSVVRHVRHYLRPAYPSVLLSAAQGQVTLLCASLFASPSIVAASAGLSRIGQLFAIFGALVTVLLEPYAARSETADLFKVYAVSCLFAAGVGIVALTGSLFFPERLLSLLGHQYDYARPVLWIIMLNAVLAVSSNIFIAVNGARRFIFYWQTPALLCVAGVGQVAVGLFTGLHTLKSVSLLVTAAWSCNLMVTFAVSYFGLRRGERRVLLSDAELRSATMQTLLEVS